MAEYIEREAVLNALSVFNDRIHGNEHFLNGIETAKEIVEKTLSADVAPVVHGKNLDRETPSIFTCSVCGWHSWDTYCGDTSEYNYCPNCGAKMDGEDDV